ncbi:TadE/TadG family type IV pilus assembly protein [Massilia aurea]|uniref:TadE/TadG family type IV pilus assembly protein n=1 Tax=Massilia aurea TaxID=373040 RepID=UPI003461E7DE
MVIATGEAAMAQHDKGFRRPATGSVALEMALILPLFLLLVSVPLYIARVAWYYSAGQKAAHDATRYIATATQAELRTPGGGFNEARVPAIARWIAQEELGEVVAFADGADVTLLCDGAGCISGAPTKISTAIQIPLQDRLLGPLTENYLGTTNLTIVSKVTMRYVAD